MPSPSCRSITFRLRAGQAAALPAFRSRHGGGSSSRYCVVEEALRAWFSDLLVKPIDLARLLAIVERCSL
jgi:hypothetical protein